MSESIAIPQPQRATGRAKHEWGRGFYLLLGTFLGLLIGVLGLAIVASTVDVVRAAFAEEIAKPAIEFPARELPREWRWQPKGLEYEHMYRQKSSPRNDWIRQGSRR